MSKFNANTIVRLSDIPETSDFLVKIPGKTQVYSVAVSEYSSLLKYKVQTVTSAQVLALHTTPVEIHPALGVNRYYADLKILLEFIPGTTPYTATKAVGITSQGDGGGNAVSIATITTPLVLKHHDTTGAAILTNSSVTFTAAGAQTVGDGTFVIKTWYNEKTIGL